MASTFELEIATPEKLLVQDSVTEAQIPCVDGEIGVLPGHAPLLSELGVGALTYVVGGQRKTLAISGGVVEVLQERVRVLTTVAELPSNIDTSRAQAALKRANERLNSPKENVDHARALLAMQRAQTRLQVASKK